MIYNVIVSPRAQIEIENAIDYYAQINEKIPQDFIAIIQQTYATLKINPFFSICYKNIRALKVRKFPYSLYFVIDEDKYVVRILSCFHNRRNPNKRPRS